MDFTLVSTGGSAALVSSSQDFVLVVSGGPGPTGPAGGAQTILYFTPTPTQGQTTFLLPHAPVAQSVEVTVNNHYLDYGIDFTVSGSDVILLSALGYALTPQDQVQIKYVRSS